MRSLLVLVVGLTFADDSIAPSGLQEVASPWRQVNDLLQHIETAQQLQGAPPAQVVTSFCYFLVDGKVQLETCGRSSRWQKIGEPVATSIEAALQAADTPELDLDVIDPLSVLPCTVIKQAQLRRPAHSIDTAVLVATISAQ
jgi:hypothetical protein